MALQPDFGTLRMPDYPGGGWKIGDTMTLGAYLSMSETRPGGQGTEVPAGSPTPGSYTVDLAWSYGERSGMIATGLPLTPTLTYFVKTRTYWTDYGSHELASPVAWTIPVAVAEAMHSVNSGTFTLTATFTGDRGNETGTAGVWIQFPPTALPVISDITYTEHSPVVPAGWPFIAGLSILKAAIVADGALGSTITAEKLRHLEQAQDVPAAGLPLARVGANTVRATVTDSRGRTVSLNKALPVVSWVLPDPGPWEVQRCNAAGVPDPGGTNLRVLPAATISSVGGLNTWTLKIWTRPPGGSWTLRNTITPGGPSYATPVLVGGGAIYSTNASWGVRVEVADLLQTVQDARTVPSGAKVLDAWPTGQVALGKLIDAAGPKTQLDGPARVYGDLTVDGSLSSQGGRLLPYSCAAGTIAQPTTSGTTVTFPAGAFTQPPIVTTGQAKSGNYAKAIVTNKTATSCKISASGSGGTGTVDWFAIQMLPDSASG